MRGAELKSRRLPNFTELGGMSTGLIAVAEHLTDMQTKLSSTRLTAAKELSKTTRNFIAIAETVAGKQIDTGFKRFGEKIQTAFEQRRSTMQMGIDPMINGTPGGIYDHWRRD